jgi:hypothetical protein
MSHKRTVIAAVFAVCYAATAHAGDLAAEVRAVFESKCASCHGPQLAKPRAGFGFVLDLKRLAEDAEKVVPSKPDDSGLWQQIQNDEMPPPNAPTGPLTAREKEVIRAWIAAGAPSGEAAAGEPARERPALPIAWRTFLWVGKLHLLMVHFPIALLVAALLAESWSLWKRQCEPAPVVRFCVALAAVTAVTAAALGWLYALGGYGTTSLLPWHRWLGTAAAAWSVAIAASSELDARRGARSAATRALLLAGVVLVGVTAHLGGLMVHGRDFYDW